MSDRYHWAALEKKINHPVEGTSLLQQVICQSHKISRGHGVGLLQDHRGTYKGTD